MKTKDYRLIEKCKSGNLSAKEWLYRSYAPVLLGLCRRYIKNRMQAEDVVHESFITIFEKISDLKQVESAEGWMKRIVINNSLKFLKSQNYFSEVEIIPESETEGFDCDDNPGIKDQLLQLDISQDDMLSIIDNLPMGFRTVFNLYVFEKYSHDEIASELGITASTSRSQLLRARKMIQKKLIEYAEQKSKKKERMIVYSAALLIMNDDLNYIDQIAFSKLNGYKLTPHSIPRIPEFTEFSGGKMYMSAVKTKTALLTGKNIVWVSAVVVGISGSILTFCLKDNMGKNENNSVDMILPAENDQLIDDGNVIVQVDPDSALDKTVSADTGGVKIPVVIRDTCFKKETVHQKVVVKKLVTLEKKDVVIDTIRKTDTLQVKK